jgi:energy-coupling factor transporter ATP-binding protein EcfA2
VPQFHEVVAISAADDLTSELEELATAVNGLIFGDEPSGLIHARERDRIVMTIRSYLLPRMLKPSAPLLVVFAGPTGAGKSTLLNSLSGLEVAETGPLRPTTRAPVVLASDVSDYHQVGGVDCVVVGGRAPILESMTLVDTPDLDSTALAHRVVAETMIDNADVVVFVSSALRYADLVPWEVLRRAHSRGAPVIHVLNRVTSATAGALTDFRNRLEREGTGGDILVVHEHHLSVGSSSVPSVAVRSLRRRLMGHVENTHTERAEVVRSVLWATLGQARELIAAAELGSTEAGLIQGLLEQAFTPDLGRILAPAAGEVGPGFDISQLALHGKARPRHVRRWVRREAPAPELVAASKQQLIETVITAVATDLKVSIHDGDVVLNDQKRAIPRLHPATHKTITESIGSWWAKLEDLCASSVGNRPDIGALLLAMCTLNAAPEIEGALAAILPATDLATVVGAAREALDRALRPVYGSVRDHLVALVTDEATPTSAVDRAGALVAEVVARSAFANA